MVCLFIDTTFARSFCCNFLVIIIIYCFRLPMQTQSKESIGRFMSNLVRIKTPNRVFVRSPTEVQKNTSKTKKLRCQNKINNKKFFSNSLINLVE